MKNTRKFLASVHIHSCCASVSSTDVALYFEFENLQDPKLEDIIEKAKIIGAKRTSMDTTRYFHYVYLEDKFFYEKALKERGMLHYNETKEFKNLVNKYKEIGFLELSAELSELRQRGWDEDEAEDVQERTELGYIIPKWSKELKPEDYKGNLSDEIFLDKKLQDYLNGGGCYGYIGSSERTAGTDKMLVDILRADKWTNRMIAEFLSSRNGRHFSDQLSHKTTQEEMENLWPDYDPSGEEWFIKETQF